MHQEFSYMTMGLWHMTIGISYEKKVSKCIASTTVYPFFEKVTSV